MSTWTSWLAQRAELRDERGTTRTIGVLRDDATIDLAGNDYLGLSRDSRVVAAAVAALEEYGAGAGASRLVTGTLPVHEDLEAALAELCGQQSALVFASGYAANLGAVTAFVDRDTSILLDEHAHASLHDAARMSRAPHETFAHNDIDDLARALSQQPGRSIVAVESVYSVLGDAAPLSELADVCARYGALLIIDEAHGIGVAGEGRGLAHTLGIAGAEDVIVTATLSKALGAQGGVVLGTPAVREHLINAARTFIFDTGLAPAAAAGALAATNIVREQPDLVVAIGRHTAQISRALEISPSAGAVLSVPMPTPAAAVAAREQLRERGVLVGCFRPPSTPDEVARLRLTARADLTPVQVEFTADEVRRAAAC
ncbi:aminotransferase class I/II-fold pyridoxal phosphate-dependent enzyme [Epidermidibacterium keratini]|uniref:8-amino-7-oxononanoate synthase n=1 Tax=Epidermidibacterium keratini TaxID=1891644 RepID=A0A7L4YQ45_9ACTN|nr:8-amino-7-oxononanoate synthase [Epidermidibacterium keratini]QHC01250.1 aminotransferase class I/II-fold pyridoxal phosphate-dependent enzyme [Epidermidibacterium keratini]